jgi:hypothetical protein
MRHGVTVPCPGVLVRVASQPRPLPPHKAAGFMALVLSPTLTGRGRGTGTGLVRFMLP